MSVCLSCSDVNRGSSRACSVFHMFCARVCMRVFSGGMLCSVCKCSFVIRVGHLVLVAHRIALFCTDCNCCSCVMLIVFSGMGGYSSVGLIMEVYSLSFVCVVQDVKRLRRVSVASACCRFCLMCLDMPHGVIVSPSSFPVFS